MLRSALAKSSIYSGFRMLAGILVAGALASCADTPVVPPTVAPTIGQAVSAFQAAQPRVSDVEYPLYTISFEVVVPSPDGNGTYVKARSSFSGFLGQNVKWISATTDALPKPQGTDISIKGATTGLFACVRFLRSSSDSAEAVRIGMDYSYASLVKSAGGTDEVARTSANMTDLLVPIDKPSYIDLGHGSILHMQATRTMVERTDAIAGMDAMRRTRELIPAATRKGILQSQDALVRALAGRSRSCP